MVQQTYIIKVWYGADTYSKAKRDEKDFFRVSCKKVSTCMKYLKNWVKQADERGLQYLYNYFFDKESQYEIIATPDSYHEVDVVAKGMIADIYKQNN